MDSSIDRGRAVVGVFPGVRDDVVHVGAHDGLPDEAPAGIVHECAAKVGDTLNIAGHRRFFVHIASTGHDHRDVFRLLPP